MYGVLSLHVKLVELWQESVIILWSDIWLYPNMLESIQYYDYEPQSD